MKLTRRKGQFLFVLLMAFFMSGVIAMAITFVNRGFTPGFTTLWLRAWVIGFVVAVPTGSLVLPLVRAIVDALCR